MVVLAAAIVTKNGKGAWRGAELGRALPSLVRTELPPTRAQLHIFYLCIAALVSRQFVEISRIRIEGLLAAFPKLVAQGQQHTYVDTDTVRYLYQPLEVSLRG